MQPERVAVVGAGAVGLTTAFDLASRGVRVTLFERDDPGAGMSGRAAGICYDAYAEDIDVAVADRAMERFRELDGEGDFRFHETPYVFLAREGDDPALSALEEAVEQMQGHGRDVSLVAGEELDAYSIRTDDVGVAGVCSNAGWADPEAYIDLFVEKCERAGVEFRFGTEVEVHADPPGVAIDDVVTERYDAVVVAAGVFSGRLLESAGHPVALKPYRVQALVADCDYSGPIVYDATDESYLRPHPRGVLAGDGVELAEADPSDWDPSADDWFVADALGAVAHRTETDRKTETDPKLARAWAGLCGATPDRNPLVGEVTDGLSLAAGWHGHGFMWAPAVGELLARDVCGEDVIPTPFDPGRFEGTESFDVLDGMVLEE
ncbi:NAD(P)/FAD-dependent oxidoreductase [Haloferax namakaokahaiae]|uniref:NAD(P)/FAD-dependent oxidoreductase n=1 Tax=Haloferax namakaokahaiae TaxID=1748331 RepID=A0ABD5ZGK7_9EURY